MQQWVVCFGESSLSCVMPGARSSVVFLISVSTAVVCVVLAFLLSIVGGVLNRGRGGYFTLPNGTEWYWPSHALSRLIFAVPTGVVVLLVGLHLRASLVVTVMTWLSLFVGWGAYMNVGTDPNNWNSRTGVFDWLVGRQEKNWTLNWNHVCTECFVRDYPAMSLRGLIWTAPQGYILQQLGFGWEYSLSGSLMGVFYFMGALTPAIGNNSFLKDLFQDKIAYSEVYWGWWIWFVIIISCLAQFVRRMRIWIYSKNQYLGFKPFSVWETLKYESLNRSAIRVLYELFVFALNVVLSCSVVFYSLVDQQDVRNKGQTFFGLFTAVLCLTFSQGWVWSKLYLLWQQQRFLKKLKKICRQRQRNSGRHSPSIGDLDQLEHVNTRNSETAPLLAWPFSHPDRSANERMHRRPPSEDALDAAQPEQYGALMEHTPIHVEPATSTTAFLILWPSIEKWLWMDIFIWIRRCIGVVSLLGTGVTIALAAIATVWDWDNPRFMGVECLLISFT